MSVLYGENIFSFLLLFLEFSYHFYLIVDDSVSGELLAKETMQC